MTAPKPPISDYRSADTFLRAGRDPNHRRLDDHTIVYRDRDGSIAIRYYSTDIVTHYPDGLLIINTGGYHSTFTTKRINAYQNLVYVYQRAYRMYYCGPQGRRSKDDPEFDTRLVLDCAGVLV